MPDSEPISGGILPATQQLGLRAKHIAGNKTVAIFSQEAPSRVSRRDRSVPPASSPRLSGQCRQIGALGACAPRGATATVRFSPRAWRRNNNCPARRIARIWGTRCGRPRLNGFHALGEARPFRHDFFSRWGCLIASNAACCQRGNMARSQANKSGERAGLQNPSRTRWSGHWCRRPRGCWRALERDVPPVGGNDLPHTYGNF